MANRAITVDYEHTDDDWTVTVTADEQTLTATAAGLVAAREAADELVEKIDPDQDGRHVVHRLDGDAFAFSTAYLHARHGLSLPDVVPVQGSASFGDLGITGRVITVPADSIPLGRQPEPAAEPHPA